MDPPTSKPPKHYNLKGGSSTDRQNVHLSQPGPLPVAKKGAHTSAELHGALITEDNSNPEINALERQMKHMFQSRGPPTKPAGTYEKPKPQPSSTQPQTLQRSEVRTQLPAAFAQGQPVATATGDRPPQPRTQTNQTTWGQTHQVPHGQTHRVPHGQMQQVSHGQAHQVPHGQTHQVSHGQTHQVPQGQMHQVSQGQTHQVPHGQTHQVPHEQTHQVSYGQTHQVPHGQTHQVSHGQTHQVSHGQTHQVPHGQTHQVPHGQTHQVPHGQTHQLPHGQLHQMSYGQTHQVPHGQASQPTQVQMTRAPEPGTSSHDQQRNADRRRKSDRIPAVTANQRTTAAYKR